MWCQIISDLIALVGLIVHEIIKGRDQFDGARALWCLTWMLQGEHKIWLSFAAYLLILNSILVSSNATGALAWWKFFRLTVAVKEGSDLTTN